MIAQLVSDKKCLIASLYKENIDSKNYGFSCKSKKEINILEFEIDILDNYKILNLNQSQLNYLNMGQFNNIYSNSIIINNIPSIEIKDNTTEINNIYTKTIINNSPTVNDNWDQIDW